jgi:hypothetical protein
MEIVKERCAGLDVQKETVVACVRTPGGAAGSARPGGPRVRHVRVRG